MTEKFSDQTPPLPPAAETVVTDPSLITGNTDARDEQERLYQQKLHFLEDLLQEQTDQKVDEVKAAFLQKTSGLEGASRLDVWEVISSDIASKNHEELSNYITKTTAEWSKPEEERDRFDEILRTVVWDQRGSTDPKPNYKPHDVTDFNIGADLDALIDGDELNNPAVLEKATRSIHLLVVMGLYKFNKWGDGDQLKTALDLVQSYTEYVPGFDPREAGFDYAQRCLTHALAALQLDDQSKPNYPYAKPERAYLFSRSLEGLASLRTTEAHAYLRHQDFELPVQQQAAPAEA